METDSCVTLAPKRIKLDPSLLELSRGTVGSQEREPDTQLSDGEQADETSQREEDEEEVQEENSSSNDHLSIADEVEESLPETAGELSSRQCGKEEDGVQKQPPARPGTAFFHYLRSCRAELVAELASIGKAAGGAAVSRAAGERWRSMTPEEREPFSQSAAMEFSAYREAMAAFVAAGGIVRPRRSKKEKRACGKSASAPARDQGPRRPKSAFFFFLESSRAELAAAVLAETTTMASTDASANTPVVETDSAGGCSRRNIAPLVAKRAGCLWKSLPSDARAPFEALAAEARTEYRKLAAEARMADRQTRSDPVSPQPPRRQCLSAAEANEASGPGGEPLTPPKLKEPCMRLIVDARMVPTACGVVPGPGERLVVRRTRLGQRKPGGVLNENATMAVYDGSLGCHVGHLTTEAATTLASVLERNPSLRIRGRVPAHTAGAADYEATVTGQPIQLTLTAPDAFRTELEALAHSPEWSCAGLVCHFGC